MPHPDPPDGSLISHCSFSACRISTVTIGKQVERGGTGMAMPRQLTPIPDREHSLPGRDREMPVPEKHLVLGTPMEGPWPEGMREATFGMGCFWGAEKYFWQV